MLLGLKVEVKEIIVQSLSKGVLDSLLLQKKVQEKRPITKQGFYKALRELVAEEVIVKNKQSVALSNLWINKLQSFVNRVDEQYKKSSDFIALQEGENITYHFKTLESLDLFWMHQFFIIAKQFKDELILFYNSHEFWSLFRYQEQSLLYRWIQDNKRKVYFVIGGTSALDKETTLYISPFGLEMHYTDEGIVQRNHFFTVIGEYIVSTILDTNTSRAVDELYKKYPVWNESVAQELSGILSRLKRSKVVIERNKKKADQLRKRLMKYFVFYKK